MLGFGRKEASVVVVAPDEDELTQADDESETTTGNHCAWCGDPPDQYGSHSICAFHASEMEGQTKWRSLQRTPSYAERFKDGRETWD